MSKQRSTLITYLRQNYGDSFGSVADSRIDRALDNALRLLRPFEWRFLISTISLKTIAQYDTGTLTTPTAGDTTVEFAGATLPTDVVTANAFLEIDGEHKWYEITERTDADTCEIRSAYTGDNGAAAASLSYRIVYPLIDLPANFRRVEAMQDAARGLPLAEVTPPSAWWLNAGQAGASEPTAYGIVQKRSDPDQMQLLLYPPPGDTVYGYELTYVRDPGWYDTATVATRTWKREATADTDYLDWPEKYMDLFYAAARLCLYREDDPSNKKQDTEAEYYDLFAAASGDDKRSNVLRTLGDGGVGDVRPESQWIMPAER